MHGVLTVVLLGLMVAIGLMAQDGLRILVLIFAVLVLNEVFQVGVQCYALGTRLAISRPLTIDRWGMEFQTPRGLLRLPWSAVTQVRRTAVARQPMLVFTLNPQAAPGQDGVEADTVTWAHCTKRRVTLGATGLVPGLAEIMPAVQRYSEGRVEVS